MSDIFKRDYVLYVRSSKNATTNDVTEIRELRITFKIRKTIELEPNTADISIYNLAENTRHQISKKGAYVHLEAGYVGSVQQIYQGYIREVNHTREGTEWVTTIKSSDGLVPLQNTMCHQDFPPGTKKADAALTVADLFKKDGISTDFAQFAGIKGDLPNGFTAAGTAAAAMKKLVEGAGYQWSIQDGRLQVHKKGEPVASKILQITPQSGLIGSPTHIAAEEQKHKATAVPADPRIKSTAAKSNEPRRRSVAHVKAKFLLQGSVRCGTRIAIQSEQIDGVYLVDLVNHSGDSWGSDWYTEVEGVVTKDTIL